jgi:hypothetical protein
MELIMSYKEQLYKNALKMVEDIYNESKYKSNVDLYRGLDIMQSLSDNQFVNKQWLVDKLLPYVQNLTVCNNIAVLGSWYGLLSAMLREHVDKDVLITNIDADPMSTDMGMKLLNSDIYANNKFIVDDAVNHYVEKSYRYQVVINTSCEHMEKDDVKLLVRLKPKNTIICFQSNNYGSVASHINTSNSLEEFVKDLDLLDVFYADKLVLDQYERYMVIGK